MTLKEINEMDDMKILIYASAVDVSKAASEYLQDYQLPVGWVNDNDGTLFKKDAHIGSEDDVQDELNRMMDFIESLGIEIKGAGYDIIREVEV